MNMDRKALSRRDFLRASGVVVVGATIAACAPVAGTGTAPAEGGSPTGQTATVTYWDLSTTDAEIAALDAVYLKFNELQNEAKVEVSHGKDEEAVLASVAAGSPPEVYWRWSVNTYGSWINKGVVHDLTPFVEASELDLERFVPIALESVKWRDKYYGMPLTSAGVGMLYWSKPLFEAAGLDPNVAPESLEQAMDYADQLTVRDQAGEITRLGFHPRLGDVDLPAIFDAHYWDPDAEQITPTDPGLVAAFEWEAAWYDHFGVDAVDRFLAGIPEYYSSAQPLCTEALAMHGGYEWDSLFLGLSCELDKFGYAKMATPAGHPEFPTCSQGAIALVIPTGAKTPEMGWKFIEYLESWEATAKICAGLINVAQVKDAVNLPEYRDHPVLKFATDLSLNTRAWPGYIPVAAEYATELGKARDLIVHGKVSAQDGLQAVYDAVQPALDQALGKA